MRRRKVQNRDTRYMEDGNMGTDSGTGHELIYYVQYTTMYTELL
jgi:hypothetical protein